MDIHYNLELNFIPEKGGEAPMIEGVNQISVVNNWDQPLTEIYLHNNSNGYFDPEDDNTAHTTIGEISGTHYGNVENAETISMKILLQPSLQIGDTALIDIPFSTRISRIPNPFLPTVGTREDTTIYNLIFFYPVLEYFFEDGWHEEFHGGKADPHTNKSAYDVTITYPEDYQIGTSGHSIAADTLANKRIIQHVAYPRAASFSVVLANRFIRFRKLISGVDIELLCTEGQTAKAEKIFTEMKELIPFYEDEFGSCLNDKLTITMGYSLGKSAGALATTNYFIYNGNMSSISNLAHEFAHQWFGEAISADETFETWLNESFAEYASRSYMTQRPSWKEKIAKKISDPGVVNLWSDLRGFNLEDGLWMAMDLFGDQLLLPIYEEGEALKWENLDDITALTADALIVYVMGSNSLFMLRTAVGDSLMRAIMLEYYERYKWKAVTTEDFIEVIRDLAGEKVADNFLSVITVNRRPDPAIVDVAITTAEDGQWHTMVKTDASSPWHLPATFEAITSAGDTLELQREWLDNPPEKDFVSTDKVVSVTMEPEGKYFDYNQFNNSWPRKFQIQPVYGLPSWDSYKIYLQPALKKDWQGRTRYGIRFQGTLGINLMPLTPSYFKNSFSLALTQVSGRGNEKLGFKFVYKTPIAGNPLRQIGFIISSEYPRTIQQISFLTYWGKPKYYFKGGISQYTLLSLKVGRTNYSESLPDDWWEQGSTYSGEIQFRRMHHSLDNRTYLHCAYLWGYNPDRDVNQTFSRLVINGEYGRNLFRTITSDVWFESHTVMDKRDASDLRTRFENSILAFTNSHSISKFRGLTNNADQWWKNTAACGVSIGKDQQSRFKPKPILYIDMAVAGQDIDDLFEDSLPIYKAAGLGLEGRSIIRYGLYFPLWVSHAPDDESNLKFRVLAQFELYW